MGSLLWPRSSPVNGERRRSGPPIRRPPTDINRSAYSGEPPRHAVHPWKQIEVYRHGDLRRTSAVLRCGYSGLGARVTGAARRVVKTVPGCDTTQPGGLRRFVSTALAAPIADHVESVVGSRSMTQSGPLPTVDEASVLQRESIRALNAVLPTKDFLFRDERADDFGVDGSLELLVDGKATNIRAQVQLKGRSNTTLSDDGTVAVPVRTSNLNYLLNGICPIYILFRPEAAELRFAFAQDEWQRLKLQNPTWTQQTTVTIYFADILDTAGLASVADRIAKAARLSRRIADRLNSVTQQPAHIVVNPHSLEVVDSTQILLALRQVGRSLTNSGRAQTVIKSSRLVPTAQLNAHPEAALEVAYAYFHLARYYDASAAIRQLLLATPQLSPHDSSLLDCLFISTRRMLGELDEEAYEHAIEKWLVSAPPEFVLQQRISEAWSEHLDCMNAAEETAAVAAARDRLTRLLEEGKRAATKYYCELLELTLQELDVTQAMIDAEARMEYAEMRGGDTHSARVELREATESSKAWSARLRALAEATQHSVPHRSYADAVPGHAARGVPVGSDQHDQELPALPGRAHRGSASSEAERRSEHRGAFRGCGRPHRLHGKREPEPRTGSRFRRLLAPCAAHPANALGKRLWDRFGCSC